MPAAGTVAQYRATTSAGGTTVLEYTEEWLSVSPTQVTTRNTQTLQVGPAQTQTESETTLFLQIEGGLLFVLETSSTITTTITAIGVPLPPTTTVLNTTITPDPRLFAGPAETFCEGMILFYPSVTETTVNDPDLAMTGPIVGQTEESTATVVSVNEAVAVTAGNFTTLHVSAVLEEGTVDTWTDVATGMLVKMEVRDAGNNLIGTTELLSLTSP